MLTKDLITFYIIKCDTELINITFSHVTIEWLPRSLFIQRHGCNGGCVRGDTYWDEIYLREETEKSCQNIIANHGFESASFLSNPWFSGATFACLH